MKDSNYSLHKIVKETSKCIIKIENAYNQICYFYSKKVELTKSKYFCA